MEINNIIVSAIRDGNYTIDFDIVGENVDVYLSIDSGSEGSFQKIFENQSTGTLSYNGNITTGTHNAKLKLTNGVDTIESDFFKIIIKKIPTITSVEVDQVLDDGSFIISYTLKGHEDDTFTVKYLLDGEDTEYAVGDNIPIGTSTYSGSGLLLGTHMLKLVAILESNEESYQLSIDNINLEVKVLPKLENIIVEGSNNGSYVLGYKIVGDANHTYKVEFQVNNDNYKTILENTTNGEKNHSGTDMPRGINICRLKVSDDKDSYISNTFNIIIKNPLSIQNMIQTDSNSKGEYKLTFDILGDDLFLSTVELKIDDLDYKTIMKSQTAGKKLYNGNGLSLGTHTAKLRIKDAVETFETETFNINIVNKVPNLSMVLTSNESTNGTYTLYYATKDVETNVLTHKLKIDEGNYIEIAPTNNNNFFTYNGNGLEVGTHVGYIQVSDGLDNVISSQFNIIIPSIEHSIKESLANAKIQYDDKFNQLTDCVTNIIVDGLFDSNLENPLIEKALENYKYAYTEFNKIGQKANDSIGTNKITDAKGELEKSISGISGAITDLENTMYGVFADGILSDTEKDTIRKQLNLISKEKVDVDKDYELLYNNVDLIEENKVILKTAYDNFIEKHNALVVTISNIINKNSIVDETDRTNMNNAFEEWRNAIANYKEKSLNSIDAIAQKKADNSADIVDKKWANIILDPETGIQSVVGNLQQTITGAGGIEERLQQAEQTITKDSITSIVSESFYKKEEMDVSLGVLSGKIENSVKSVDVMYYLSTSDTELIGGNWDTLAPTWEIGKYMWSKTVTTMIDNTTSETTPVCISSSLSKKFEISTNRQVIAYDSNNNLKDPTNIILTVDQQNFSDAITWSTNPTVELTGTGNTRTMYASNFANNDKIVVTVTSAGFTDSITLVKVRDGVNGQNGIDGKDGKDGTSVTILGSYNTKEELDAAHPTGNTNGDGYIVGSNLYVWIDTEFKDVGQIKGEDAITYYTWIKYANDSSGGGISDDPTGKEYIGFAYNKTTANESNNPNDYTWSLFKGTDGTNGINGVDGKDGTTYYTWIKYSDSSDGSNMYDTPNNNTQYIGIAVNKISQAESTDKTQYSWSKFRGDNGVDGIDGTDGVDAYTIVLSNESHTFAGNENNALTSNTSINILAFKGETQVSTNIGKINDLPTGMSAIINNNNTINTSISISVTTSMTSRNGVVNIPITVNSKTFIKQFTYSLALKGQDGTNGKGIKSIVEYYKIHTSNSGITNESAGFTTNIPTMNDTNKYLWNYELITYTDNSTEKTTARVIGMYSKDGIDGTNGTDGKGITSITNYYLATPSDKGITTSTSGWTTTIQTIDANKKYLWNYEVINYTTGNPTTTTPCIIGSYGRDGTNGVGIKSITNYYLASFSSTNVTVNTSGWTTTVQIPDATNKYLWNYEKVIYTDDSEVNTNPCIIGNYAEDGTNGEDGKGIQSIVEYYARSSSNTNVPTNFSTTVPTLDSTNRYLWNYEVINYTTGNPTTTAKKVIGVYGDKGEQGIPGNNGKDGIGVSLITEYYQVSTSNSNAPTSWSTTVPTLSATNKYLWNYEVITYTNNTTKETAKRVIGVYGDKGIDGIDGTNGEDGVSVTEIINYYLASSSETGITVNTSGWSTSVPTLNSTNKYLWNYEKVNFSNNTHSDTTPCIIGNYAQDGKTTYFHVKYSEVENPTSAQMTETPSTYIGTYVDYIESDSTDPSKYTWSRFKGEQGIAGTNGEDGKTYYLHIKYSNDGTTFTSDNGETEGIYIGMYTDQNVNDSTNFNDYKWSKIQGTEIESITEEYYLSTSKTTQVDGEWVTTAPVWSVGKYMWTRSKIVYKYPSSVKYTIPVCDTSWEAINELKIGIRNLVINSAFKIEDNSLLGMRNWRNWGNPTTREFVKFNNKTWCHIVGTGDSRYQGIQQNSSEYGVSIEANTQYTFSALAYGGGVDQVFTIGIDWINDNNDIIVQEWKKFTANSLVNRVSTTFTSPANASKFNLKLGVDSTSIVYDVYFTEIKLDKGNKVVDWTPAPEDTENLIDDAIYLLEQDLQGQIDGKIQTYYQTSDPSSTWANTENKTKHIGDIWYNGSYTYRWTGTTWDKLEDKDATNANALASKKAQVFTTIPTVPYYKGDLWITNLTGSGVVKTCQTTRTSGNYTSSDWVEGLKYTDDTLAEENKKIITTVKQTADKIYWLVESGDSSSSMTLTKDALDIIAANVRINGNVIVNGSITGDKMAAKTITADKVDLRNLNLVNDSGQTTLSISSSGNVAEMKIDSLKILANGSYESPMSSSQVQQTVDAFERKFVESGGYNKLKNSAFKNGFAGWNNLSWNNNGGMGGTTSFGVYEAGHEWALTNRNVLYAFSGDFDTTKYDGNQVIGVGVDSDIIWGGIQWTFSCLVACHRANSVVLEIIEYDSNNNRLPNMNTWTFYKSEVGDGGQNRDAYYKINKEFTLLNAGCAYFQIRLYLGVWEQNPLANAYLFFAEPQLVLGHKGDIPYTLNADEFYAGIIKEDASGIIVSMADGEGAQGYSKMAYDGFSIYNAQGTRKAWFGDSDSAYIQNLLADDISCPTIVKYNDRRSSEFFISPTATGDGTGRNADNKSNSINYTLNWIKGVYGCVNNRQDLILNIEDGIYNENIYIGGWMGTGRLKLKFGRFGTLYGSFRIEENSCLIELIGNKGTFENNEGWIIENSGGSELGSAIYVRNSTICINGFRSRNRFYYGNTFIYADDGSRVSAWWNDIVGYNCMVIGKKASLVFTTDIMGDINYISDGSSHSQLIHQGYLPLRNGEIVNGYCYPFTNLGGGNHNSTWIPKVIDNPTPPPPPAVTWQWFSQSFTVSNLRSVPEGTGSTTSGISGCMAQGYWGSYKAHRGYGDLGDSPASYCSGARNITITCTMHRKNSSHGNNSATPHPIFICLDGSSWDSGTYYARNDSKTFTFPAAITDAIANGSMKTLQIWAGRSTAQYAHFDAVTITITCEKQV